MNQAEAPAKVKLPAEIVQAIVGLKNENAKLKAENDELREKDLSTSQKLEDFQKSLDSLSSLFNSLVEEIVKIEYNDPEKIKETANRLDAFDKDFGFQLALNSVIQASMQEEIAELRRDIDIAQSTADATKFLVKDMVFASLPDQKSQRIFKKQKTATDRVTKAYDNGVKQLEEVKKDAEKRHEDYIKRGQDLVAEAVCETKGFLK